MIGRTISHYRVVAKLGEGGMGVVYRAEDLRLQRQVALKFLAPGVTSAAARERFVREAQAASAIDHPNICTVHEIGESPEHGLFIAMPCYEGETLQSRLERGPLPLSEALDLAIQATTGLGKAHEKGIVHRDVKPANLFVTGEGLLKIVDFGLARLTDRTRLTQTGGTAGTIAYMAPEQFTGAEVDHRADLWAVGLVLYEMVAGVPAFRGDYANAVMYAIVNEEPVPLGELRPEAPAAVRTIVAKALAKDPARRHQSAMELLAELRAVRAALATAPGEPGGAPVPGGRLARVLRPGPHRRRAVMLAAVALALAIGAAALAVALQGRRLQPPLAPPPVAAGPGLTDIAVLPFQNLSAEASQAYFAGGLHDELLTQLAKVAALKVISRTSVMGYEGTKTPLRQIARELGVGSIVEGSVQVVGGRLRVNVQLIEAATDRHLWAESYDRTLDDAFAIQSDVAHRVVAAVGAALTGAERMRLATAPTANAEAYRLYLEGLENLRRGGREGLEGAQPLLERALELEPGFALAHAMLSHVHGRMYYSSFDPTPERAARLHEEAEAALRLAPDLPEAHLAMGLFHYWAENDFDRALAEFTRALKTAPNDERVWFRIGDVHRRLGNWDAALVAFERYSQLAPRDAGIFRVIGNTLGHLRRYPEALRAYETAQRLGPGSQYVALDRAEIYLHWQGQLDSLRAVLGRMPRDSYERTVGAVADDRAKFLLMERNAPGLLEELRAVPAFAYAHENAYRPLPLYAAWAHELRGDPAAARTAYEAALAHLDSAVAASPEDWRLHGCRGLALAGLGRRQEALQEAQWLGRSVLYYGDAWGGSVLGAERIQIFARAADLTAALEEIERFLSRPSWISVNSLRLDPLLDPIRDHPQFQQLLAKYAEPGASSRRPR